MSIDLGRDICVEKLDDVILLKGPNKSLEFPFRRWKLFADMFGEIDQAISEILKGEQVSLRLHIGGNVFVSISKQWPHVDVRQFWLPKYSADVCPTRTGISLKFYQFYKLKEASISVPDDVEVCFHQNLMDSIQCQECNPNEKIAFY